MEDNRIDIMIDKGPSAWSIFYPCTRFAQYSLRNKKAWIIGNIHDGIDKNKLRPFLTLDRCTQSTKECIK